MRTRIAVALLSLFAFYGCQTSAPRPANDRAAADIARFVERALREIPEVPSIGIAVVRDGKPYYANAFGLADVEARIAAGADTGYYIASSTKSYTGLAAAILADRGQIDLDAPISKYLPEVTSDAGKFTLRQYLTHTAPVVNDPVTFRTAFSGEYNAALLVQLLNSSKPRIEGFKYANLGYVVASMVMERVTGQPWQRVMQDEVFFPLGMTSTTSYVSVAQRGRLAVPYDWNRSAEMTRISFAKDDRMMHAAGGIVTTPEDLGRWLAANVQDGRIAGRQSIPAAPFAEAHRPQVAVSAARDDFKASGYGFGWYIADYGGDKVLFHLGGFQGWQAHVSFMPERKIGVAVVTNSGGQSGPLLNLIAAYIYDRLLEKPDAETRNALKLTRGAEIVKQRRERFLADVANRAKRTWTLSRPASAYAGRYTNDRFGTIVIEERGGKLVASIAQLSSELEAYTDAESARVELPPGSGSVLRFSVAGDSVESFIWEDEVFRRTAGK